MEVLIISLQVLSNLIVSVRKYFCSMLVFFIVYILGTQFCNIIKTIPSSTENIISKMKLYKIMNIRLVIYSVN